MRWFKPKAGAIKVKKFFAILPVSIGYETRWLQKVTVEYKYNYWHEEWQENRFIDKAI